VLFQSIGRLIALVDPGVPLAGTTIASLATVAALFAVFLAVFRRGPRGPVGWRASATGALVAAEGIVGGAVLLGLYLRTFGWESPAGAVVGVLLAIAWVALCTQAVLMGAEMAKVAHRRAGDGARPAEWIR
ncbi:MAG: YhjD/YihY/BrkB family envelope integrity protein, partial [Miltoncostaeaceae bacterium]